MRKLFAVFASAFLALAIGKAAALVSSYGSVSGYAFAQQSLGFQVVEQYSDVLYNESNETYYVLYDPHQGETKWVELKLSNAADAPLPVNLSASIVSGDPSSVELSLWNIHKNESLSNPLSISAGGYRYVYLRHYLSPAASPGEYAFAVALLPAP